jgi:hypothetical protein
MITNMNFPVDVRLAVSPGLLRDRIPGFRRDAYPFRLSLKPDLRAPDPVPNKAIWVITQ